MNKQSLNNPCSLDKVSFKRNRRSLSLVLLEKKLFTQTHMPQSDAMSAEKSADIKKPSTLKSKSVPFA